MSIFNELFSLELPSAIRIEGNTFTKHLAVKQNTLGTELLILTTKGKEERRLLCEMSDELRGLILSIERE